MAEISIAAGAKVGEAVISRVTNEAIDSLWRQIGYVWNYKSNLQDLKEQLKKLIDEREGLQHRVYQNKRNGRLIESVVTNWFERADDAVNVAQQIIKDHESANKSCFIGCCPNLNTRYQFSRKAKKHIPVFAKVQGERSSIKEISYVQYVQELERPKDYEALESRTDVLKEIVGALKNVDFNLVGVYGMAGVGKTTLATEHLVDEVKRDGVFKVVTWAKVTRTVNVKNIQQELAEWLGLNFEVDSTQVRALRLCERLKKEEKVLVILDDIWQEINLKEIGIPNDKDSKGCKVFMTSRHQNVLLAMGVQEQFVLEDLQEKEAWQLFQTKLGDTLHSDLQPIAFEVSKRCVGLPGLITAVATTLRNQPLVKWKDSLDRLKKFDHKAIDDKVNSALELSYDFLEDDARLLFLLCGQNGPLNIDIKYLLKYGLGLGIFKSCNTIEAARIRLHSLVNDLKASCWLLESGDKDGVLKMHDLVHNFAITIASKDRPVITSNRMSDWPDSDTLESCVAMVLHDGKVPQYSGVLNCPRLRFFLLNNGDSLVEVGDNFFGGMEGLRVLNLKNASFLSLPSSLKFLKDLQTLCLDSCVLEDATLIGQLKKLEVFSLVNCTISRLPREVGDLTHLKLLDLKDCSRLEVIEPNVLSRLTRLEELYMGNSFAKWEDSEGNNGQLENASLIELKYLSKLVTVHVHIADAKMLPKDLQLVNRLEDFKILIGEEWDWNVEHKTSRTLKLKLNTRDHLERVKGFLMRTEDLYLDDLQGVENVLDSLNGEGFPQLKHLLLQNSQDIQYIIDWRLMGYVTAAFPNLESLFLSNLNKLEMISSAPSKIRSFGNLKTLKVGSCSLLRYLFSFSMFRTLQQLEEIDVSSCEIMKMVVVDDGQDGAIKLDKLQMLRLDHLPQFASFCSQGRLPTVARTGCAEIISEDETETPLVLFGEKIGFPNLINMILTSINVENIWSNQLRDVSPPTKNLRSLIVDGCSKLSYVFTSSMVENLAQLERLEISHCSSMKEVIAMEEMMMTRRILFPKLDHLKLKHLPKLERFCSGDLIECPSLNVLRVESCPHLQTFVSSSMQNDASVTVLFDEKVSFPKLEELQILHMHRLKMIWKNEFLATGSFEKLNVLRVEHAKELLQLFPSNMFFRRLMNLETVVVKNCDLMEQVFDMEGLMQVKERLVPALRTLDMGNLPMLKSVWSGDTDVMEIVSWINLRSVTVHECLSLKSLFPASIAIDLQQLEELDLSECVLLEEIIIKGLESSPTFVFPKLKYIQLYKLYELRNFYPGAHTLECPTLDTLWVHKCEKLELFTLQSQNLQEIHEKNKSHVQPLFSFTQLVPNLKDMSLSYKDAMMIKQNHIPAHLFHGLKELRLECFYDETSYLPFDLLQRFQNIQKLHVACSGFEEVFPRGLAGDDQNVGILRKIQFLKLNGLKKLRRIWNEGSHHKQVLRNLETFEIYGCDKIISLLPSFATFQNLQTLNVEKCHGLMNLLEPSAAKSLVQLKTISVKNCNMITEIVETNADEIQTEITLINLESLTLHCLKNFICFSFANCPMKFPSLTEVIVTQCPKMKFFSQRILYSPKIKKVYVTEESDKWRWVGDFNSTIKQLSMEMVGFDSMQHLELSEFPELKEKWLGQLPVELFSKLITLVVDDCAFRSVAIPSKLPPFLISLEEMEIRNCALLEELYGLEWSNDDTSFGYLSNLKEFQLIDLPKLRHVWDEIPKDMLDVKNLTLLKFHNCSSLRNILTATMCLGLVQLKSLQVTNCEMVEEIITPPKSKGRTIVPSIVFPLLECIIFEELPNLTTFYSGAGYVECPCLKEITVASCPQLNITNTVSESKVVSFHHLEDMKATSVDIHNIWNCQGLTSMTIDGFRNLKFLFSSSVTKSLIHLKKLEISNCGMLEQVIAMDRQEEQMMRLQRIEFLKLKDLPKLAQFCTCDMLECAALKELQIENCPQLVAFVSDSSSSNVDPNSEPQTTTPALFDEKVAFPNLEKMAVIKMDNLRMIWSNHLHSDSFGKLEVLKVEYGRQLMKIFPHNILARLPNLKDFVIKNCDLLEEVFDIHALTNAKEMESVTSQLQTLDIRNMVNLRCVWNEDPKGLVSVDKLSSVYVWECPNLKSLFPFSIAKRLQQLEDLQLDRCGLVELVAKETGVVEEAPKFVFPHLKYLFLWHLEKLEFFFQEIHTLDCPVLERLSVLRCEKLEVFMETIEKPIENQMDKSLFSFSKIIPNLKEVSLTSKDAVMIMESQFPLQLFDKLKVVDLLFFDSEWQAPPSDLLNLFHNMEQLSVRCSMFKELFPHEGLEQALQSLKLLYVYACDNLISLAPFTASFQNLTNLKVNNCDGLVSLMGHSTARSLVQLQKLSITECDSLSEIVLDEGSEDELQTEIALIKLESLKLYCLKSLVCFSLANCPIKFPSLTEVIVTQCPKMKFFSQGNLYAPKVKKVYVTEESNKWRWVGDFNSTIKQMSVEMAGFDGMQHLELSEFPVLKEKWLGQLPVELFSELATLVVDDCPFQSVAIPSKLPPFLIALEKMEIRNCALLEELYGLEWSNDDTSFGYLSNLKEFQLIDLPKLRHVWDEIPKHMLDVKNITLLKFHNCSSLRNILTATLCLGLVQLKNLQVTNCQMVEEIITPPKPMDRTISPSIIFPLLECIVFEVLPNLTAFYSGAGNVECPCLKEITVADCPQLNITNTVYGSKVVSFHHLEDMKPTSINIHDIWNCQGLTSLTINGFRNLKFLFSSSVTKSLIHLKKLEISNCGMMEQVIAMDGQEEQMMRLQRIEFLKLKDLPKLAQFCTCDMLECAALKELQIENCPQLVAFVSDSASSNVDPNSEPQTTTPALFDEKVAFPNLERMEVIKMDNLRMIWSNHLHSDSFGKLEVLKVEYGRQLMKIFPHNILARLPNLKDFVIKNCDLLEEVFDIHALTNAKEMESVTSQLQTLDIGNMVNLRCVWNEDPKGLVSVDKLSSVYVWECPNLKSLFPFSIAKRLQQLEDLQLDRCGLVELVAKETGVVEEAPKFVFPHLKYLFLWHLEKLEFFFQEIHTLDCPVLESLSVLRCEKLEVFMETIEKPIENQMDNSLFSFSKIIPNLKLVSLTSKDAVMIMESQFPLQLFDKLKGVELHCFDSEWQAPPSDLLNLFHNMEELNVRWSMFKELFPLEGLDIALQNLKDLLVANCENLISLAPFSVSFQTLTYLDVKNCKGLVWLMGLSTAKSLVQLEKMRVSNCDELSEIVSNEGSDVELKEIMFTRLQSLELNDLPSLISFCSEDCSFKFPSLTQVIVSECPNIKFFSKEVLTTPKLKKVRKSEADEGHWSGNLNATVKELFTDQ